MKSGCPQRHFPLLSIPLPCSKITQSLDGVVLVGVTRNYSAVAAISDFFHPVARPARNNDEVQHVHALHWLEYS
jgi:hypothetical protein